MNKKIKKVAFQNKLILSNFLIIIFIIVVNVLGVFVYNTMNYNEYLSVLQYNTVAQIGNSYETIIGYIQNTILKKAYEDNGINKIVNDYTPGVVDNLNTINELEKIIAYEDFIGSAHLYLKNNNVIISSCFQENNIDTADKLVELFGEDNYRDILNAEANILSPQIIKHNGNEFMAITMVMEIKTQNGNNAFLIVNIDLDKLGKKIINKNTFLRNKMYIKISNNNGDVFYTYSKINTEEKLVNATYYSQNLDWTFDYGIDNGELYKKFEKTFLYFILVSIASMLLFMLISIKTIKKTTNPVSRMLRNYYSDFWITVLTNDISVDADVLKEIYSKSFDLSNEDYVVVVLTGEPLYLQEDNDVKIICISKEEYVIIIKENGRVEKEQYLDNADSFVGISSTKNGITYIHNAYLEAKACLNFKICTQKRFIEYEDIKHFKNSFEYDYDIERKIVNSINIADYKAAEENVFNFFDGIKNMQLEDTKIISAAYKLQNAILKNAQSMQIVMYADDFSVGDNSLNDLRKKICDMIKNICDVIRSEFVETNKQEKSNAVMDLIDNNYTNPTFGIDFIAEKCKISKNEIAKIVKFNTSLSFPEYVNRKKIEYAKKLLKESNDSIEVISKMIGYSYSYYFIKVFRESEGITPKQYRNMKQNGYKESDIENNTDF